MHFLLFYDFVPDYLERRVQYRGEHLHYAWAAQARGELFLAGALADPPDQAVLVFQGEDDRAARAFAENDPYVRSGLVTSWSVRRWITVVGDAAATPPENDGLKAVRIWTLHPQYLDPQGLVALWREGLLARAVLRGETKGYRHHPQLQRFQQLAAPRSAINHYLAGVLSEAQSRGYSFDATKVGPIRSRVRILGTEGQLQYEWQHLLEKLRTRSPSVYRRLRGVSDPVPHPLFRIVAGPVASWERVVAETKR